MIAPSLGGVLLGQIGAWSPGILGALIMGWLISFAYRRLIVNPDPPLPARGEPSILGTRDGLANSGTFEATRKLLPSNTRHVSIEGGNHAQMGWYARRGAMGRRPSPGRRSRRRPLTPRCACWHPWPDADRSARRSFPCP